MSATHVLDFPADATAEQIRRCEKLLRQLVIQKQHRDQKERCRTTSAAASARRQLMREKSVLVGYPPSEHSVERYTPEQLELLCHGKDYELFRKALDESLPQRSLKAERRKQAQARLDLQSNEARGEDRASKTIAKLRSKYSVAGAQLLQSRDERLLLDHPHGERAVEELGRSAVSVPQDRERSRERCDAGHREVAAARAMLRRPTFEVKLRAAAEEQNQRSFSKKHTA